MSIVMQSYYANGVNMSAMSNIPDRIYSQYRNSPKAVLWYNITKSIDGELYNASNYVRRTYDIDNNVGAQLDVIGRIVEVDRDFMGSTALMPGYVASQANKPAMCGNISAMCSSLSIDQDGQMSDEIFRIAIRAKIIRNNSSATIDGILDGVNYILPTSNVLRITDSGDMSFGIEFYGRITSLERWALRTLSFVQKPQGVRFNGFLEGVGYVSCGDKSKMCGDTSAQCVGFTGV